LRVEKGKNLKEFVDDFLIIFSFLEKRQKQNVPGGEATFRPAVNREW
jgi:hypothetical protein